MPRRLISSGSTFEKSIGYSRAVVDGDWIFVSGTTGFDYATMTIQDDVVAQCEQAFRNIEAALKQADSSLGDVRPAATMMVVGLADAKMKIEIEVTALRKRRAAPATKKAAPARAKKSK